MQKPTLSRQKTQAPTNNFDIPVPDTLTARLDQRTRARTGLAPPPLTRRQAVEPNRLDNIGQLYINVQNFDPMDSLMPFELVLPNNEDEAVHAFYDNTPQNREQMMLTNLIQLSRQVLELRNRIDVLEGRV